MQLDVVLAPPRPAVQRYRLAEPLLAALVAGDTALLRGSWLLRLAAGGGGAAPVLPKRQDCPQEAFWQPDELRHQLNTSRALEDGAGVPIVAVSYCWETAEHADPSGERLRRLVRAVELCLGRCPDVALFVDWGSLYQEPRTEEQQGAFDRSLESVDLWFAHQMTWVWQLRSAPYEERGWPCFEWLVGGLVSHFDMLLDLGSGLDAARSYSDLERCAARRRLPVTPGAFRDELAGKVLRRGGDRQLLADRYASTFAATMCPAEILSYANQGLTAAEAKLLSDALRWCMNLVVLSLDGNDLGPDGAVAIAQVLPGLFCLQGLYANRCGVQRGGAAAIIQGSQSLDRLGGLYLCANGISQDDASVLEDVFLTQHPRAVIRIS